MKTTVSKLHLFSICCTLAVLVGSPATVQAVKFTGNAGTAWSNGNNWEGGQAPIGGGTAEIIDKIVDLDVPVSVSGVTLSNGTIRGAGGSLTVTGQLQIASGGFFSGPATTVTIPESGSVKWSGGTFTSNFTMNNSGVIEVSGPVAFEGTLNNAPAGSFVFLGDYGFGHTQRVGVINNAGRIVKQTGNGVSQFSGFTAQTNQINTTVNNTGTVEVASGTLEIGSGTSPGNFIIAAGKTLLVQGNGPHTFDGATFTGAGKLSIASSATFLGQINSSVELELLGTLVGGNAQVPQGSLTGTGKLTWRSGAINGAFTIGESVYSLLTGPAAKSYTGTPINKGTMDWAGPGPLVTNSSTFRNEGTFNLLAAGTFAADTHINGQTFENVGTLNTFPGGTSQTDDTTIVNAGTVNIGGVGSTGILRAGRVFFQTATGKLHMEVGGANAAEFDQLLQNFITIDGTLVVELLNGYAPAKNARFTLVNPQSGKFANVVLPGGTGRFAIEYPGNSRTDLVSLADGPVLPQLWAAGRDFAANEAPNVNDAEPVNRKVPQWSYGFRSSSAGTALTLFGAAQHQNGVGHPEVDGWLVGVGVLVNTGSAAVTANIAGTTKPLQPGQMLMLPTAGDFVVARWTAPEAGTYNVAARWVDVQDGGGNGATGHVVVNGTEIFGGQPVAGSDARIGARWENGGKIAMAPQSLRLEAGATVDFVVGSRGDANADLTAMNAVIRRAPHLTISAPATAVAGQDVVVDVSSPRELKAVALQRDGAVEATLLAAPFQFVLKGLTPGIYHLQAEGVDADGVRGASNVIILDVSFPPAATARGKGRAATAGSTYEAIGGVWSDPQTWRRKDDGATGAGAPGPSDVAIIPNGVQVVLTASATVSKVFTSGVLRGETDSADHELVINDQCDIAGTVKSIILKVPPGGLFTAIKGTTSMENVQLLSSGEVRLTKSMFGPSSSIESTGNLTLLPPPASGGPVILQGNDITLKGHATLAPGTVLAASLVGQDGSTLVGQDSSTLVGQDSSTLVGQDSSTLVGQDGASLVGQDSSTLVGQDSSTLVGQDGASLVGQDGASLVGQDGGSLAQINAAAMVQKPGSGISKSMGGAKATSSERLAAVTGSGLVLTNGGTLAGNFNVIGNLTNDGGFVMPGNSAGSVVVAGDYAQTSTGGFVLEVGGTQAGQFDLLKVLDTASLGGKLIVKTINGSAGGSVTPLTYGSVAGGFESVSSNAQVSFGADGMTAQVSGPNPPAPKALNIATRMRVETGDNVLIAGFIITGDQPKRVLVRGIGPSLPVAGALADPTLDLDAGTFFNDDWRSDQQGEIEGTTIPPSSDVESAIVATLDPGAHTAVLRGKNDGTGVGLVEVYDLESGSPAQLANISTRGQVQTGDNVMIGGFIIGGDYPAKVLLRAIGPSLPIEGALQDPTLELVDSQGNTISNDNWRATQEAEIIATTVPPANDREAAIVATLVPGAYTAVVRGKGDTIGVALVEGYTLQ